MTEPYDSTADTRDHINRVRMYMDQVGGHLERRSSLHDRSKLVDPEKVVFDRVTPKLKGLTYGSDEYNASLAEMGEGLKHHYSLNRHHPEHWAVPEGYVHDTSDPYRFDADLVANGTAIGRMSLLDILEMLCDWKAATERHADGSYTKSLEINRARFGIGEQLFSVIVETARELGFVPRDWIPFHGGPGG